MAVINQNSDFLFVFQASMTNCNGDPDQENKPRMDYETSTVLVSDGRRKRDVRDFLKNKGYPIFVDTLADRKVPMDKMFEHVRDSWLADSKEMELLFSENQNLSEKWHMVFEEDEAGYKNAYHTKLKDIKAKKNKDSKDFIEFNNILLTEIIKRSLIDIRLFGSAMAVEGVSRTYTGPVQIAWGYSLHAVELVKSNTITSIMNDDNSTFGKKHKLYYALVAHYGTINKYSAKLTGMTEDDRELLRKSLVQGLMSNQTDSKQGQEPMFYLEIVYKPEFDGYLGDLRRFLDVTGKEPIRKVENLTVDFNKLTDALGDMKKKGYVEKVVGWRHPFARNEQFVNMPEYEVVDLWSPIPVRE
ncbi:CRISPR-associated protein, CT1132 family [Desulfofarcimen acetoxidans DSM 771]|jgi:CRISPR-associated protein Csh2|uniref:CRISPR-associated protein, CT1132 family n=1 Tax=Desulfofarcimen acetoxidans (strain ATCC 49208 / DSM 771 / KCTC 5769 / VKM B-1644 / 5575) TaxID=485916 RepID=C8VZL2_DESAS|nr:CRISPR-associated protein [Desulfofarcimen acetoxidans]ACV64957.1 CRISPR-associated protein, CT1132 family [Desulfofarcimen acetoxidans DSM 771]